MWKYLSKYNQFDLLIPLCGSLQIHHLEIPHGFLSKNVREFVDNNSFKYITDYKIKVYYDKIIECVTALCRAKENHEVFPDGVFEVNHIKELINRMYNNLIMHL